MSVQTIFLTGASGLIGAEFMKKALEIGFKVRALTRDPNKGLVRQLSEVYEGDLAVECDWRKMLEGVDFVIHTAAEIRDKNSMQLVNYEGSLRLLNAAIDAGVRRWVQVSSVGAYGPVYTGVVDESWNDNPATLYEKTKSDFDKALVSASELSELEVCILRPSNVYGSAMRNHSIRQLLSAICRGWFFFVGPKGASANYVHVKDVAQAISLCINSPNAANQTYIISAWASVEDMVNGLASGAGHKPPVKRIPLRLATLLATIMQWWPRWPLSINRVQALSVRSQYSTKKIEFELGWVSSVPVKEGMYQFAQGIRK